MIAKSSARDPRRRIIHTRRDIFCTKKGNECRCGRDISARNRQEERCLAAHISESVRTTRVILLRVTSVSRLMSRGHPWGRPRDILEQQRTHVPDLAHIRVRVRTSLTRTRRREEYRASERLSAVDCMMDASGLTLCNRHRHIGECTHVSSPASLY